jgi:DNA primase
VARIPNQEIERLKREIPIERLMSGFGFGVELKRTGAIWSGAARSTTTARPSLIVTPETNLWRCMATNPGSW